MAKQIRYTKELAKWICDRLENGISLPEICRRYPERGVKEKTVYKWRRTRPEFKELYDTSYQTLLYIRMNEMDQLSASDIPSLQEIMDKYNIDDPKVARQQVNAIIQQRRLRVDTLKFMAAKMAPKFIPELSDKLTIEHEGGPQIQILEYYAPETPKLPDGTLIEHEE